MFRMKNLLLVILITVTVKSFGVVQANFSADRFNGCPPLLSNFQNTSTTSIGTLSYRWDFANGNTSILANPTATFFNSGTYRVKLVVSNGIESDSITKSVRVYRLPQVDFTAVKQNLCFGDTLVLQSNVMRGDAPISDYAWGFGNGIASSSVNTSYVYTQTGVYDITLVIQDSNRCSVSLIKPQYINVVSQPVADFTASPANSCSNSQLVNFSNSSVGYNLSYLWQLTSTVTSTATNPSHTYGGQSQNVQLIAMSPFGCNDTVVHRITIGDLQADFFADKTIVCSGQPVQFTNGSNLIQTSLWNFGDGVSSNQHSPEHTYYTPGVYTVKLVERFAGCADSITKNAYITVKQGVIPNFSATVQPAGCNDISTVVFTNNTQGSGLSYTWAFDDGTGSAASDPAHIYNANGDYQVVLTVTSPNGCESSVTKPVHAESYVPYPSFAADTAICRGANVHFNNYSATSGQINWGGLMWLWTFGDGDSSIQPRPNHVYQNDGVYDVSLTVRNSLGCDTTVTKHQYIHVDTVGVDFVVDKTFSPCPPFVTIFSSTCNKSEVEYLWNFGDGNTDTAANPTHIYFHPGIFTVSCTVTTPNGCSDTRTYPHLIEVQGPYGLFGATPTSGCAPLTVDFAAAISPNTQTMWCDLGNGTLITDSLEFSYTYSTLGVFNPKFILVDHLGCAVPYDLPAIRTYQAPPLVVFDTAVCPGATINVAMDSSIYTWSPNIYLSCDTCGTLTITPDSSVNYILSSANAYCVIKDTVRVVVEQLPVLTPSVKRVCANSSLTLYAGDAYSINWSPALYLNNADVISPVCMPLDTVVYTVTAANSLGCSVETEVTVNALDKLDVNAVPDLAVCAFDTLQLGAWLTDTIDAAINYNWTPANYLNAADIANPTGSGVPITTEFKVVATSGTCIADTASVLVTINKLPTIHVSENVTTTINAEVKLWASSQQSLNYTWTATDSLSCTDCRRTNLYPLQSQMVYVTGVDAYGCKASDSLVVKVLACDPETVFLPNVFTPNGDGLNDVLFMSSKTLGSLDYFRIFDQWGQLVYETKNMSDTWDGNVHGQPGSIAVFAYVLQGKCQNGAPVLKYGNVSLVR